MFVYRLDHTDSKFRNAQHFKFHELQKKAHVRAATFWAILVIGMLGSWWLTPLVPDDGLESVRIVHA